MYMPNSTGLNSPIRRSLASTRQCSTLLLVHAMSPHASNGPGPRLVHVHVHLDSNVASESDY